MANRPVTGTRPIAKTAAFDSRLASPSLANDPAMQTPFAWLRRKPGCRPATRWNVSMIRPWVSSPGESHPPA